MDIKQLITGFRKFIMALVFLATAVALLLAGYIPSEGWLADVGSVMTAFMATNLGEHIIEIGKKWIEGRDEAK